METTFSPIASLGGGVLIGLSAVMLMLGLGRIAGATGILSGALLPLAPGDRAWRIAMIAGMIAAPVLLLAGGFGGAEIQVAASLPVLAVGGIIVGIGVTLGAGCTSGHGVCGLARLSPRSLVATLTFMASTGLTVYVTRHVMGG